MSQTVRLATMQSLLLENRGIYYSFMHEKFGISLSTFKRDLVCLRDSFGIEIFFDSQKKCYCKSDVVQTDVPQITLPPLLFAEQDVFLLLMAYQIISEIDESVFAKEIENLKKKLLRLLSSRQQDALELRKRLVVTRLGKRKYFKSPVKIFFFALIKRKQMRIFYHARQTKETTERIVSPQRLVYYRDNWYLDCWCHFRQALRSFALERIERVDILKERAVEIAEKDLAKFFKSGYGIFSGERVQTAHLLFSSEVATWVSDQHWHTQQKSWVDKTTGAYHLQIPYTDERELMGDILRYGSEVSVIAPKSLKDKIKQEILKMTKLY